MASRKNKAPKTTPTTGKRGAAGSRRLLPVSENPDPIFQNYVLGFFDLLGTKQRMEALNAAWQAQHSSGSLVPSGDSLRTAMGLSRPVVAFRRHLSKFFEGLMEPLRVDELAPMLDPAIRAAFIHATATRLSVQAFSDTVIVFFPLKSPTSSWFQFRALAGLFESVAVAMAMMARQGCLVRGSIAMGCGVELFTGEIYGPVLSEAYRLESTVAKMPRVVVDHHLVKFLTEVAANPPVTPQVRVEGHMARIVLEMLKPISEAPGEFNYVDYASSTIVAKSLRVVSANFVAEALEAIAKAKLEAPEKDQPKYDYLLTYLPRLLSADAGGTHAPS